MASPTDCEECSTCGDRQSAVPDNECFRELASTENLYDRCATLCAAYEPARDERCWRDRLPCLVGGFERGEVYRRVCDAIRTDRASAVLAMTSELRELLDAVTNFWTNLVPSASSLPFTATTAGLAALTATTDRFRPVFLRARRDGVELHT